MSDYSVSAPNLAELQTHRSEKWRGFPNDVLPLPVAEMDFPVAQPIRDVLTEMVAKSDLGYLGAIPELGKGLPTLPERVGIGRSTHCKYELQLMWELR